MLCYRMDVCMLVIQQEKVTDAYAGTNVLKDDRIVNILSNRGLTDPKVCNM